MYNIVMKKRPLLSYLRRHRRSILLMSGSALLLIVGAAAVWAASLKIPDIASFESRRISQSAKIYDRTGEILLDDLNENVTRTIIPIEEMSPYIQKAAVAIEDDEFYTHHGVRPLAIIRAVLTNLLAGNLLGGQGGSTITQQVVKNSVLTTDKSVTRKVKEWVLSLKLEQSLTKQEILELYLNEAPYGGSLYGVEEAAGTFFGKRASEVSLAEAAYLAALPQAPTYYSPYGNHRIALESRKNLVLQRMRELGFITEEEYRSAKAEEVVFQNQARGGMRAPHFVFYVRELLEKEFGRETLERSGWRIITTLDADLQEKAEEVVKRRALQNEKDFNAENAAIVATDPKTGDILVMAGSRDYFDPDIDGAYNIALAERQPGSAFKPFVYAAAFLKGYTPETILFDVPTQFSTDPACPPGSVKSDSPCYAPGNYDEKFRGPMTIRNALAQSINIPAVKALYLVGIRNAIRVARSMGISTLESADRYGLTLVLGGGEVTLLDMVSSYGTFANEGVRNPYRAIMRIEDKDGNEVRSYALSPERVLDQGVALAISDILSDNVARAPTLGSALSFPGKHVAGKTGTTNDSRDAWVIGYTPSISVGAWAGNNDNSPMVKKVAGLIVVPLWHEFMDYALTKYPSDPFPEPPYLAAGTEKPVLRGIWQGGDVVPASGDPALPGGNQIFVSVHSILYWVDKDNPRGPRPANPASDPQFTRWEWGVRNWAVQNGYVDGATLVE